MDLVMYGGVKPVVATISMSYLRPLGLVSGMSSKVILVDLEVGLNPVMEGHVDACDFQSP